MRTLYVSDLDGTLLNRQICLSNNTIQTINQLIAEGMLFTYATARNTLPRIFAVNFSAILRFNRSGMSCIVCAR